MRIKGYLLAIAAILQLISAHVVHAELRTKHNDLEFVFSGVFKPDTFYGKNINWLNNKNGFDKVYFSRHILDLVFEALYGGQTYGENVVRFFCQIRNRGVWGNHESIASTTVSDIKLLDTIRGAHKHGFPRHILWIRQLWLQFNLGKATGLPFKNTHTFTIGAFPFQLGRGIALGDAFAVGQEFLGFWSDSSIDQYAFGAKFSGEVVPKRLSYDAYTAILQNNSSSIFDTEKKVLMQSLDDKKPERGFGKVNYVVAGRLSGTVFDNTWLGRLTMEPYGVYNNDPEQKIEFIADASSKLGTIGLASEFYGERLEFGFDYAVNLGQQRIKGWDRNIAKEENRQGVVVVINDNVTATYTNLAGEVITEQAPFVPKSDAQKVINEAPRGEDQNGQQIPTSFTITSLGYLMNQPGSEIILTNSTGRFGKHFTNKYKGWMFVTDASYAFGKEKNVQVAVAAGAASGDDHPHFRTDNREFNGFIGIQETYSGKRVRSVFLLGGAGKVKRFLSTPTPTDIQAPSKKAQAVSGFTNLVFCGTSLKWTSKTWEKPFEINPNVLALWQERKIGNARTFLGIDTALFINWSLMKDLKLFWVSSIFFPGSHFKDRMGSPVFKESKEDLAGTNLTQDRIAELGANVAYTFNVGLIYTF